jgi:hypothetical protein
MTTFSHSLVIGQQQLLFCFSEIVRLHSSKFYVSVTDNNKAVLAFEMKKEAYQDKWSVCQPAPDWILGQEATFSNWIRHTLSQKKEQYPLGLYVYHRN